jgi:hypothetical protein
MDRWLRVGVVLLVLFAAVTRLPAPWRAEVTNDELHHLESWRNRYRSDDVYPLFRERVRASASLSEGSRARALEFYALGPLAQRALFVLVDPQPPLFPLCAEAIEATTLSSLSALRLPSLLASCLALGLAFLLGRELRGPPLGLWLATLAGAGAFVQLYAGIGRPYAWAHAGVIGIALAYVRDCRRPDDGSPWRLLVVALVVQSIQWLIWPVVGLFVLCAIARRRAQGGLRLLRWAWWYALLSCLLLVEMAVHLRNPTISAQSSRPSLGALLEQAARGSPFASLSGPSGWALIVGGLAFLVLLVLGAWRLRAEVETDRWVRLGLGLALCASLLTPLLVGSTQRFMVGYLTLPSLAAALGAAWLAGRRVAPAVCVVLGLLIGTAILRPLDPYEWFPRETQWSQIATKLQAEHGREPWATYPYFFANCLYRYRGDLPDPTHFDDPEAFREWLKAPHPAMWLVIHDRQRADVPELSEFEIRASFANDYRLLRLPERR